jgi:hypothetical protein
MKIRKRGGKPEKRKRKKQVIELTPLSQVHLEKTIVTNLVKKFQDFTRESQ